MTTVAQRVNEFYRAEREYEILRAFKTITREEVLFMLESFIDLGIITVNETKTKVNVKLHRTPSSYNFNNVLTELDRTCVSCKNDCNGFGQRTVSKFKIEDAIIQITY